MNDAVEKRVKKIKNQNLKFEHKMCYFFVIVWSKHSSFYACSPPYINFCIYTYYRIVYR